MATEEQVLPIQVESHLVAIRRVARDMAKAIGLSLVDQTKFVTAASELARNTLQHGGGGECRAQIIRSAEGTGVRLVFIDQGPGIADLQQALSDGYTSVGGLGLGLGGAKRLVNDFHVESRPGEGTSVTIIRWA
jgi:serine/threonine-protein kinase RsbT